MNFFLLLKNELSLHFLRQTENIVSTCKAALRIHSAETERERNYEEQAELKILDKILHNQPLQGDDSEEEQKSTGRHDDTFVP